MLGSYEHWIGWIRGCLQSSSIFVLVNGSLTQEFKPRRELRQDDLLASFLFLIVAEDLAGVIRKAMEKELLESVTNGEKLQYADDTLFFCEANPQSVFVIKAMLNCFELALGLKVNYLKRNIGGVGCSEHLLQCCATILNCKVMRTPFKYLELLIRGCHKIFWEGVVERVRNKLERWKGKFISMAGRLCLIKLVLSSLPLFYMLLYKMSTVVIKEMEKLQRGFLWG